MQIFHWTYDMIDIFCSHVDFITSPNNASQACVCHTPALNHDLHIIMCMKHWRIILGSCYSLPTMICRVPLKHIPALISFYLSQKNVKKSEKIIKNQRRIILQRQLQAMVSFGEHAAVMYIILVMERKNIEN